jgi:ubiquinone/menaquinone biosynthesis C-methylase UbiE
MKLRRAAEKLFDFPHLYRAKFALTGLLVRALRPLVFRTLVTIDDVIAEAAIPDGARVVEIGCGDGHHYRSVTAHSRNVAYIGVDINPAMIAHCTQQYPGQNWMCATPPYPFADAQFDFCVLVNVLHHLNSRSEVERILVEASRIAKTVVLFEPLQSESAPLYALKNVYWWATDGGSRYLRLGEFRALFAATGLRVVWERYSSPLRHFYGAQLTRAAA